MSDFEKKQLGPFHTRSGKRSVDVFESGNGNEVTVGLVAGIHGDEKMAQRAVEEFLEREMNYELDLSVITQANPFATAQNIRKTSSSVQPNRADEPDMNRTFSRERESGRNLTAEIGSEIIGYLEENVDFLIDCHTGAYPTEKAPQVRYKYRESFQVDENEMQEVAMNSGLENMIVAEPSEEAGMLAAVAPSRGMPALTIEMGGARMEENELVEKYLYAVKRILDYIDSGRENDEEPREFGTPRKYFASIDFDPEIISERPGEIEYRKNLGEKVDEGETVAEVRWFLENGEKVTKYEAGEKGLLETVRNPENRDNLYQNDRIFNIALTR